MRPGIGVMLRRLGGSAGSGECMQAAIGKKIAALKIEDNALRFTFEDGTRMQLADCGQSCCESRWMSTDDDLPYFVGAELRDAEVREAPPYVPKEGEYCDVHDVEFLVVQTSKGDITLSNHNEHNGYYGGFSIEASEWQPAPTPPSTEGGAT